MNRTRILDLSEALSEEPKQPFVKVDFARELSKVEELSEDQVVKELKYYERQEFKRDMESL